MIRSHSPPVEPAGAAGWFPAVEIVVDTNIWLDMLVFDDWQIRRLGAQLGVVAVTPAASERAASAPAVPMSAGSIPVFPGAVPLASRPGGSAGCIVITLLATDAMRAELADVIGRASFGLTPATQAAVLGRYDSIVTPSAAAADCRLPCRDPDDRKFLDLAIGRRAHWLLSRDRALLAGRKLAFRRFALRIGGVADFYDWLDGMTAEAGREA